MIIAAASSGSAYSGGDQYADNNQYGSSGLTSGRYGDTYGTGTYSEYRTSRGRYRTVVEIAGYGTGDAGTGYGYTADDTGHSYSTGVTAFDYVIDVLDGDAESGSGDAEIYIPVEIST